MILFGRKEKTRVKLQPELAAARTRAADQFLRGSGVEIGALHNPLPTNWRAQVTYVDRMAEPELRKQYPELDACWLQPVDAIDDGEKLETFTDSSLDFVIGSHMLEHTENPIGTIRNHTAKLKVGGVLFYVIPRMDQCFDRDRPLTSIMHLINDDKDDGTSSRIQHYREWAQHVEKAASEEAIQQRINILLETKYSIHFHVWTIHTWIEFIAEALEYLQSPLEIIHMETTFEDIVTVLRKR